jgi:hypothetical protein
MGAFLRILLLAVAVNAGMLRCRCTAGTRTTSTCLDAKRALTMPDGALADWNPGDATPCRWTGVSCDVGTVTVVSLASANLVGPFPSAVCRILRLASLNLNTKYIGCGIAGENEDGNQGDSIT